MSASTSDPGRHAAPYDHQMLRGHPIGRRRPAPTRAALAIALLAVLATLAGCTSSAADLPAGPDLLARAGEAMRGVRTAAVSAEADPGVTAVPLRSAQASVTADGQLDGTAVVALFGGPPVEYRFVVTGGTLYLAGPTGGFQQLPLASLRGVFDPTALLSPAGGLARLLGEAKGVTTEARETVDGVDSFRIAATFPQATVATVVPTVQADVPATIWVDAATSRLVHVRLMLPDAGPGTKGGPLTVRFADYDAPVTITPPA